jgi:hypothetical protein
VRKKERKKAAKFSSDFSFAEIKKADLSAVMQNNLFSYFGKASDKDGGSPMKRDKSPMKSNESSPKRPKKANDGSSQPSTPKTSKYFSNATSADESPNEVGSPAIVKSLPKA